MVICVEVFGVFLMFIKLSSYSNLITHMFVISVYVVHFIMPFINRPSAWCFLSNQVLYLFKFYPLLSTFYPIGLFLQIHNCSCSTLYQSMTIWLLRFQGLCAKTKVPNNRGGSSKRGGSNNTFRDYWVLLAPMKSV